MVALAQPDLHLVSRAFTGLRVSVPEARVPLRPERREECRYDLTRFIQVYFPYLRTLNRCQQAFANDLQDLILSGAPLKQLKALAAPRGGGKSTICQLAILWAAAYGHVKFVMVLAANRGKAEERIGSIKEYVLQNDLLAEDFPEICQVVRDFGGDPRRAPPAYPWATLEIRFANGVWITAAGIDGAIAGALRGDDRPDLIILDDIEAGTDVDSEAESGRLRKRLNEALALTPQQGTSTVIFVGTLKSQDCLSAELTDARQNPAWRGGRYRALEKPPVREDLWEAFMGILKPNDRTGRPDQIKDAIEPGNLTDEQVAAALEFPLEAYQKLTDEHKASYAFYAANREAMDEGAQVLDAGSMPLRRIYEERAILGEVYFRCELQNDPPPPPDKLQALQLEALQSRMIGVPQRTVPGWADVVLVTCDVGLRSIHWEASAWSLARECSIVIDCGMASTGLGADGAWELAPEGSKASLMERGIRQGLDRVWQDTRATYARLDGGEIVTPYGAVDMGGGTGRAMIEEGDAAWAKVVIGWCAARQGRWFAVRGAPSWSEGLRKLAGDGNWAYNERGFITMHSGYYKTRLYDALQMPIFDKDGGAHIPAVGSRAFNSNIPDAYLRHMMSEERDAKGKWVQVARQNHFWDCAYMSFALADIRRRRPMQAQRRERRGAPPKWGKPIRRRF